MLTVLLVIAPTVNARLCSVLLLAISSIALSAGPVEPDESSVWLRHAVPLPREASITGKITLKPEELALENRLPTTPAADRAVQELRETLRLTNAPLPEKPKPRFTLTLQLGGPEAEPLRTPQNPDQAYRIFPERGNVGLRLVAVGPRGVYYAAKTLQQLARVQSTPNEIVLPLLTVRDWPEMEDRGLWGVDAFDNLEWLAKRKLNYVEQIAWISVDAQTKRGTAKVKPGHEPLLSLGPKLGIEFVPVVLHLEQLEAKGVFEAFPNLRPKGNPGKPGAICYSQPEFVGVLADWLADLARLPHVSEVDVWMAENLAGKGGCKCDACRQTDRSLLELRTILAAWRKTQERVGKFGLRVLTSEETYPSHRLLLAELPPDVKLWYYHSLLTYTAWEKPMITGDTAKLAASGHWVGVCPSLVAHVGFPEPFSNAQFVEYRLKEFSAKKLGGILGYPSPRVRYARLNVEAMAEWSWNPDGRSAAEFCKAWATREGIRDADKFAEWAALHGQVAWDVYGSDWPAGEQRKQPGPVAELLQNGKLPELGNVRWGLFPSPWGDIQSAAQLDADVEAQARAVALARELGVEEFLQESLVVQGYVNALRALWKLKQIVTAKGIPPDWRPLAEKQFEAYAAALTQAREALPAWERAVAGPSLPRGLVKKSEEQLDEMIGQMQQTARTILSN